MGDILKDWQSLLAFVGFFILPLALQLPDFDWVRESGHAATVSQVCQGYVVGYMATFGGALFWKVVVAGKINDWLGEGFLDRTISAFATIMVLGFAFAAFYGNVWGPGMEWYGNLAAAVGAITMSQGILALFPFIDQDAHS